MHVILDIGHGQNTYPPSKGIGNFAEHDFNSKVGVKPRELLEKNGIEVTFTQEPFQNDTSLKTRVKIANDSKADLFISIHANASSNPKANGYGVFYYKNCEKAKRLATSMLEFAESLPIGKWGNGLWESIPNTWSDFYVLRETKMDAVLIEHFFYTNPEELEKCNTEDFIKKSAEVIAMAVCEHFGVRYNNFEEVEKAVVEMSEWAKEAHKWVVENGISDGTRPRDTVTREELWTMLHRMK